MKFYEEPINCTRPAFLFRIPVASSSSSSSPWSYPDFFSCAPLPSIRLSGNMQFHPAYCVENSLPPAFPFPVSRSRNNTGLLRLITPIPVNHPILNHKYSLFEYRASRLYMLTALHLLNQIRLRYVSFTSYRFLSTPLSPTTQLDCHFVAVAGSSPSRKLESD
jgi:hypothetical protein